jgi:hypothetical protein
MRGAAAIDDRIEPQHSRRIGSVPNDPLASEISRNAFDSYRQRERQWSHPSGDSTWLVRRRIKEVRAFHKIMPGTISTPDDMFQKFLQFHNKSLDPEHGRTWVYRGQKCSNTDDGSPS